MNTPSENTIHLVWAFEAVQAELKKIGIDVEVSRRNDAAHPVMKRIHNGNTYNVGLAVERSPSKLKPHMLRYRTGYGRGGNHRYPVGADGKVNAKALAPIIAERLKWDDGAEERDRVERTRRAVANEAVMSVKQQLGYNPDDCMTPIRGQQTDGDAKVMLRFEKVLTPYDAIVAVRALRNLGIDI